MNTASAWRRDIAQVIARSYARHPHVDAVVLSGSTARGHADRYSDIELGIFWTADPTEEDRAAAIHGAHGDLHRLYPPHEGVWEDNFFMGRADSDAEKSGVLVEVLHIRVEAAEQVMNDVLLRFDDDEGKQNLIAGIGHGLALHGKERV